MINAFGNLDYLKLQLNNLEEIKNTKLHKKNEEGWEIDEWTESDEEKINLLKELIKYKSLYLKAEDALEEYRK